MPRPGRRRSLALWSLAALLGALALLASAGSSLAGTRRFLPLPPVPACEQPIDAGPCRGAFPRFGHDAANGACVAFQWGGCGGNDNRFESAAECAAACQPNACALPIEPGDCEAAIPRWAFSAERGACVPFFYGGCNGNANNFTSESACVESCGGPVDVCSLPSDGGPCDAAIPRWYYDAASGHCERFTYGGCGGNANNFETLEACEVGCLAKSRCRQPIDPGPCRAAIPRWGFHAEKGECVRFTYGGCAGNDNNFPTRAACERGCPACDEALCGEHQTCRLFRDPTCREREERCRHLCAEDCQLDCEPVPLCVDECEPGACPPGTRCELVPAQCLRLPCPPVRHCVPEQNPCAVVDCGPFQTCRVYPPTGEAYCADVCARGACPDGTVCRLVEVTCVRAPCPPVRECVEGADPCSTVRCVRWQHCDLNAAGRPICVPN